MTEKEKARGRHLGPAPEVTGVPDDLKKQF